MRVNPHIWPNKQIYFIVWRWNTWVGSRAEFIKVHPGHFIWKFKIILPHFCTWPGTFDILIKSAWQQSVICFRTLLGTLNIFIKKCLATKCNLLPHFPSHLLNILAKSAWQNVPATVAVPPATVPPFNKKSACQQCWHADTYSAPLAACIMCKPLNILKV